MMVVAGVVVRFSIVVMVLRTLVRLMLGAVPRVVPVVVLRRLGGMVAASRVMMVVGAPRSRFPVRNITTGIQQVDGEDGVTGYSITIHRAAIGIAVNRKTGGIITGSGPGHRGTVAVRRHAERAITIRVYRARAQ